MIRKIVAVVSFVVLVAACSKSSKMQRGQQQYQTVQEGSASGVTSTINGPGETPAPITDTNIDTTTNFTLPTNPNPLGNSTAGTSVADSIPTYPGTPPVRRQPQPRTDTQGMVSTPGPIITDTIGRPTPPMPKLRTTPQPETDTTTTSAADPNTTTATQTTTASDSEPAPAPKKKGERNKSQDQEQPPPPPPPTDTTGTQG